MPIAPKDIIFGFAIPAIAALMAMVVLRRVPPVETTRRYAPSLSLLLGFQLGYWLLGLGELATRPHFQWLPFAFGAAALMSIFLEANGNSIIDRLLGYTLITTICGWFLIPTYDALPFEWWKSLIAWTSFVVVSSLLARPLEVRFSGPMLPMAHFSMAICAALILILSGSLSRGQIAGATAGASFGLLLATVLDRKDKQLDGITFPAQFFFGSIMMIGQTNSFSEIPVAAYYILPLAPLGLWLGTVGPLKKMTGKSGAFARFSIPLLFCLISLGWALSAEFPQGESAY